MLKISDFYLDKQKSFIPKKNMYTPWIALFSAKRWRHDVLTFLIKGFDICHSNVLAQEIHEVHTLRFLLYVLYGFLKFSNIRTGFIPEYFFIT